MWRCFRFFRPILLTSLNIRLLWNTAIECYSRDRFIEIEPIKFNSTPPLHGDSWPRFYIVIAIICCYCIGVLGLKCGHFITTATSSGNNISLFCIQLCGFYNFSYTDRIAVNWQRLTAGHLRLKFAFKWQSFWFVRWSQISLKSVTIND